MNPHFERAQLLYHQGRYEQAEESLRRALTDEPDFALAHAFLALCMVERKAWKDATEEAERAIGLAPDNSFAHQVHARVLLAYFGDQPLIVEGNSRKPVSNFFAFPPASVRVSRRRELVPVQGCPDE